jgi:outer membrane protein assembly factor BamD
MRMTRVVALALLVPLALAGCAGKRPIPPAETLWSEANQALDDEAWEVAIERYKALLDQHPFDAHAEEAELRIARAYYLAERFPEAIAAFENFERMHPTSKNLAEVEYHRGMSYALQQGTADRDQRFARSALTSFRNVIDRFPGTPWATRAELRIRECREALARHEGLVAEFYLGRHSLRAAEARLAMLLKEYPDTDAAANVLGDFATAWRKRGERKPATLALETLLYHHPQSPEGVRAQAQLGGETARPTDDPLPDLLGWIKTASTTKERLDVPRAISAFPDAPAGTTPGTPY